MKKEDLKTTMVDLLNREADGLLADHDKEVRKQVCNEIRDKFIHILNINDGHYSYEQLDDDFNNVLDQIEKGAEVEE